MLSFLSTDQRQVPPNPASDHESISCLTAFSDGEFIKRRQQGVRDPAFEGGMTCIIDKSQVGLTAPGIGKSVRCHRRADDIVASLNDVGRQMANH